MALSASRTVSLGIDALSLVRLRRRGGQRQLETRGGRPQTQPDPGRTGFNPVEARIVALGTRRRRQTMRDHTAVLTELEFSVSAEVTLPQLLRPDPDCGHALISLVSLRGQLVAAAYLRHTSTAAALDYAMRNVVSDGASGNLTDPRSRNR